MNPYNFVPLGPAAQRRKVRTHESFDQSLHAGTLVCRIKTLTDIFLAATHGRKEGHQHERLKFARDICRPIIPGSSLKGMIRSVVEALSGSCMVLPARFTYPKAKGEQIEYKLPFEFKTCDNDNEACPACRIFGLLGKEENNVHAGSISIEDAHARDNVEMEWITVTALMEPKPRHEPWYVDPSAPSKIRGRKFYLHRAAGPHTTSIQNEFNKTVEVIKTGAHFEFTINYSNLADDELALLIFALTLEDPMRHKIGMGKGLGLGSVQITIQEWRTIDLSKRYQQLNAGSQILSDEALAAALQRQREKYHSAFANWQGSLQALREIWTWDEKQTREVQYPSYMWFKDFSTVPLEEVPDDAGQYKLRQAPQPQRGPSRSGPYTPRPEDAKAAAEAQKETERLLRLAEKEKQVLAAQQQAVYQNNATESKAQVEQADDGSWLVVLPKLPQQKFSLKTKSPYSSAKAGAKIRVRVLVDKKGYVVRAEEL